MSHSFRRFMSALMAIVMVTAMVPSQAFAASEDGNDGKTLVSAGSFDLDFVEETALEQPEEYPDDITEAVSPEFSSFSGMAADTYVQSLSLDSTDDVDSVGVPNTAGVYYASPMELDGGFAYQSLNKTFCAVTGYSGSDTELVIPSQLGGYTVQTIADGAFENNTAIVSVTLPGTVESVGSNVFFGCTNLVSADLSQTTMNALGSNMFDSCSALKSVQWPQKLTLIDSYAFAGCTGLREVDLPDTLTAIYAYAFEDCQFTSIDIPDSVTALAADAFYNCTKLAQVGYPAGWTETLSYDNDIGYDGDPYHGSPFQGCSSLREITVDEGVTAIPKHAFRNLTALETITLPGSVEVIEAYAFAGCTSLTTMTLPETLDTLDECAFQDCSGLTSIRIPAGISTINSYVFSGCTGLREVDLPDTLTAIYAYAFEDCQFTSIDIPDSVTALAADAFYNCTKLAQVGYPAGWTETLSYDNDIGYDGDP